MKRYSIRKLGPFVMALALIKVPAWAQETAAPPPQPEAPPAKADSPPLQPEAPPAKADDPPPEASTTKIEPGTPWISSPRAMYNQPYLFTANGRAYALTLDAVGRPESSQRFYGWLTDRQFPAPRPNDGSIHPSITGLVLTDLGGIPSFFVADASGRVDTLFDRTRLTTPLNTKFLPSQIPVRGQPFFGNTEEATVTGDLTQFRLTSETPTALGTIRTYFQNNLLNTENGRNGFNIQHVYAQLNNTALGKTFSVFTDPDIYPDSVNQTGPNAYIDNQDTATAPTLSGKAQLRFFIPMFGNDEKYVLAVAVEQPTVDANVTSLTTVARTPDFAAHFRWQYDPLNHVQVGTLYRLLGAEDATNTFHQSVSSWGVQLSLAVTPFSALWWLQNDMLLGAATYGEGIAAYNIDLTGQGDDLALDSQGNLVALPLFTYFVGYTHFWSEHLRSTAIYSQVNLDNAPSQDPFTYHRGRYAEANLVYEHTITAAGQQGILDFGLGFIYGDKRTLNGARGNDYRVVFVVEVRTKPPS